MPTRQVFTVTCRNAEEVAEEIEGELTPSRALCLCPHTPTHTPTPAARRAAQARRAAEEEFEARLEAKSASSGQSTSTLRVVKRGNWSSRESDSSQESRPKWTAKRRTLRHLMTPAQLAYAAQTNVVLGNPLQHEEDESVEGVTKAALRERQATHSSLGGTTLLVQRNAGSARAMLTRKLSHMSFDSRDPTGASRRRKPLRRSHSMSPHQPSQRRLGSSRSARAPTRSARGAPSLTPWVEEGEGRSGSGQGVYK